MSKYILPIANDNTLGGIKTGDYISTDKDGKIKVDLEDIDKEIKSAVDSVKAGKEAIANAITDKGVETSSTDSFQTMANNIEKITGDEALYNMYLV